MGGRRRGDPEHGQQRKWAKINKNKKQEREEGGEEEYILIQANILHFDILSECFIEEETKVFR